MSLPSKGLRKIEVKGVDYCWLAKGDDGYINLFIENSEQSGQLLSTAFSYHPGKTPFAPNPEGKAQFVVTPSIVRKVIEHGLANGWTPNERKPVMDLGSLEQELGLI